jgi:hypothetical protein
LIDLVQLPNESSQPVSCSSWFSGSFGLKILLMLVLGCFFGLERLVTYVSFAANVISVFEAKFSSSSPGK